MVVLFTLSQDSGSDIVPDDQEPADLPPVTFIVAAYNEAGFIAEKIRNTLGLDYPENKLEVLFVTDGFVFARGDSRQCLN